MTVSTTTQGNKETQTLHRVDGTESPMGGDKPTHLSTAFAGEDIIILHGPVQVVVQNCGHGVGV